MIEINVVYTKTGDQGETSLGSGERVSKCSQRIECIGNVDELNSHLGLISSQLRPLDIFGDLHQQLRRIQNECFNLGAELAMLANDENPSCPHIRLSNVKSLETEIDDMNASLPPLKSFVLPGGNTIASCFHIARTVCRRAERSYIRLSKENATRTTSMQYLNRLSDWLFVASRWAIKQLGDEEITWSPR